MRLLTNEELSLVAGGNSSSSLIIVTGYMLGYDSADSSWYTYEIGSGGSQGDQSDTPVGEPNATPCVETELASGVSQTDANRAALAASNAIAALNDETYEYSSIVWTLNGVVGYTVPYTDNSTEQVNWLGGLDGVPSGATIIGIVHNHPDISGFDDRYPSGAGAADGDWDRYRDMIDFGSNGLPRGIGVDANMLLYIYTNQDHNVRVYDKTDQNNSTQCAL